MSSESDVFDFLIMGGGTNGLSAASYLGKEGYSTLVVERQDYVGGGAITKELTLPGFKHDVFATSINIWRASSIQEDLELEKYGLRIVDPDPVASTPFKNGKAVTIYRNLNLTMKTMSQFSQSDAAKFREVFQFYLDSRDLLLASLSAPPLSFSAMMSAIEESDNGLDFLQFSYLSARDWLEETFESEEVKAFMSIWGSNHVPLSPEDSGSAILVLVFIGLLQERGVGVPIGGMTTLAQAFSRYVEAHRGRIITGDMVIEVLVRDGRAYGVKTASGRVFRCKHGIISNVEPKTLFLNLVPDSATPQDFRKKVKAFRFSSVSQVMIHGALDGWLTYRPEEVRMAGLVQIGDSLDQVSRAYNDCVTGRMPSAPFMTIDNTSCYDSSRAPQGKHTLWNFVRAPVMLNGMPWSEEAKESFADLCMDRLADYAPNSKQILLKRVVLSPQDIEGMDSNIVNGDAGAGKATMDQALALRPFPSWSQYATPVKGLYMGSASVHPGGGVSGLAGHNAAYAAIQDIQRS